MNQTESVAVAMWKTPWYLKLFGYPAWRVKTSMIVSNSTEFYHSWYWRYYKDINDYAEQTAPKEDVT